MPKIGEPVLTSDVQKFFENTIIDVPESEAMPEFWEPEAPTLKTIICLLLASAIVLIQITNVVE